MYNYEFHMVDGRTVTLKGVKLSPEKMGDYVTGKRVIDFNDCVVGIVTANICSWKATKVDS
jgi:hypothetical protein